MKNLSLILKVIYEKEKEHKPDKIDHSLQNGKTKRFRDN